MKITKDYLKRIIKEEMNKVLKEQDDSYYENWYEEYFDFSPVEEVGNKLNFDNADALNDIYEAIYIDDPRFYGRDDDDGWDDDDDGWDDDDGDIAPTGKRPKTWAETSAEIALEKLKDPKQATRVMRALLEKHRGGIEQYVKLINDVGEKVTFNYEETKRKQAEGILAEMIKLLSIGKKNEDLDY